MFSKQKRCRISFCRPKEKNIVLGVVYRPPKVNWRDFINNLDSSMAQLSSENKVCYVMADWNLDVMKHHCHDLTRSIYRNLTQLCITLSWAVLLVQRSMSFVPSYNFYRNQGKFGQCKLLLELSSWLIDMNCGQKLSTWI